MNKKWALVLLFNVLSLQTMARNQVYAYNQWMYFRYNSLELASLEENLKNNRLDPRDKEYIGHLVEKIKKEYVPIQKRWASCYSWPIKSLEEVSWNDMETYLAGKDGFHNALSKSTAPISARY